MRMISMMFGLSVAILGLANVMPTFDVLPRIGPFELSWFRPLLYWLCMLSVLAMALSQHVTRYHIAVSAVALTILTIASWDSYQIGLLLEDSVFFFGEREFWISSLVVASTIYIAYTQWGLPIAILGVLSVLYLLTGEYWPGFLGTGASDVVEIIPSNLWYSIDQGILGSILGIVSTTVLPFIILGAVLEGVGAGGSMIRIAFFLLQGFRGGPAYAAVASSALFGTVSGSAVANVVGTGVITIPMIKKRGFSSEFSGAVEASASTGGQILPPIMGAAALVMADIVGVSYATVMLAAIVPALAYYSSLFLAITFEAQRLGVQQAEDEIVIIPTRQDWYNLLLVFGPVFVIVYLLISGMSPAGASISAILLLFPMSFLNPDVRQRPSVLVRSLAQGGTTVAKLISVTAIVGIVVATLAATGLPSKLAVMLTDAANTSMFVALIISAIGCIILGMGMPTLPAYIAIISVMGTTLQGLGLDLIIAHLFVFTFGVASVITPPVAIASYAAASIAEGRPIGTAVQSSRVGAMIFLIPFAFVYNPALTLGAGAGLPALDTFLMAVLYLGVSMYLVTSGLIGFDRRRLSVVARLGSVVLGIALISGESFIQLSALALAAVVIFARYRQPHLANSKDSTDV